VKLNGTHQVIVYAGGVNMLGGSVQIMKKNTDALVVASKKVDLKVDADKTKYMVMSRDQNAGRTHSMNILNKSVQGLQIK